MAIPHGFDTRKSVILARPGTSETRLTCLKPPVPRVAFALVALASLDGASIAANSAAPVTPPEPTRPRLRAGAEKANFIHTPLTRVGLQPGVAVGQAHFSAGYSPN